MTTFDEAFEHTVGIEGRYSNNPNDSGGETMYGITVKVARANGYRGDMRNMPIGVAREIYFAQFWNLLKLEEVAGVSPKIAKELFDTAVNCGTGKAGRFLQRALNALNRRGKDYPDIEVDGNVGPMTIDALRSFFRVRGFDAEVVLYRALNSQQGTHYIECAEISPKNEDFEFGWFLNRVQ